MPVSDAMTSDYAPILLFYNGGLSAGIGLELGYFRSRNAWDDRQVQEDSAATVHESQDRK